MVIICGHPNLTAMISRQYYDNDTSIATYSHYVPVSKNYFFQCHVIMTSWKLTFDFSRLQLYREKYMSAS